MLKVTTYLGIMVLIVSIGGIFDYRPIHLSNGMDDSDGDPARVRSEQKSLPA
jgi:hypothetical protein